MISQRRRSTRWLAAATIGMFGAGAFIAGAEAQPQNAAAGGELLSQMAQNPDGWVMPSGNYANWRYSKLDRINASNAKDLQVAWTMATGTDRGLEGQPLVIGDMMYVENVLSQPCLRDRSEPP